MWIIIGLVAALLFGAAAYWLKLRNIILRWYEWVLGIAGLALLLFTLQNYYASKAEFEPTAPVMFLVVFGIPALVLSPRRCCCLSGVTSGRRGAERKPPNPPPENSWSSNRNCPTRE